MTTDKKVARRKLSLLAASRPRTTRAVPSWSAARSSIATRTSRVPGETRGSSSKTQEPTLAGVHPLFFAVVL